MIKTQNSKVLIGLALLIICLFGAAVGVNKYLTYRELKSQTLMVAQSSNALKSFQDNYFQCNDLSRKTLEKFVNNHELKVRRLMLLKNEDYIKLEQELDNLKLSAKEKLNACDQLK